jgi:hypothetical protein
MSRPPRYHLTTVEDALSRAGYSLARWSPGDRVTRYRIVPAGEDYFSADATWTELTALGRASALTMALAFLRGLELGGRHA